MRRKFLEILCDPVTKDPLSLIDEILDGDEIIEGTLVSPINEYPIINGIPRFVPVENYSDSFGYQWRKWPRVQFEADNLGGPMEGHTRRMFEKITEFDSPSLNGKLILDIGIGPGRFSDVSLSNGATVVGLDYSLSAVEAARRNFLDNDNILMVQGDALSLPFKNEVFDFAFSIGVLHHTPDPKKGCEEANRILKSGGEFAMCVYGEGRYYDFTTTRLWRRVFRFLWPVFRHYPPLMYTYLMVNTIWPIAKLSRTLSLPIRILFPIVNLPDKRWSILDTFDSLTPSYQSAHTSYEVWTWFEELGFKNIRPTDWGFTSYKARK